MKRKLSGFVYVSLCCLMLVGCGLKDNPAIQEKTSDSTTEKTEQSSTEKKSSFKITFSDCVISKESVSASCDINAMVEVENTGSSDLYLDEASFNLRDQEGTKMFSNSKTMYNHCPDVISPSEKGYFYLHTWESLDENATYTPEFNVSLTKARSKEVYLTGSDLTLEENEWSGGFDGKMKVTNTTDKDQEGIEVAAVLIDDQDHPFNILSGSISDTLVKDEATMVHLYSRYDLRSDLHLSDSSRYETFAYTRRYFNI